ncbi:L-rhamnose mutarotase [Halocynthiibacter sp. C4]|uniref:L-rhamnose mutarotase n=1 Tax=Halocynthiibacter sp. C4 TaxID=2992758 RepID=UPI00237BA3E6|nr:L-rhamnose mutarotase [Halocynthiibacter sp. C4]MDE0589013.1 L-rhamnose mutarotase [Halocynthiibacter sp. C4]
MTLYRRSWSMQIKEGAEEAYDSAHAEIWPEMRRQMEESGIIRYYLFRTGTTIFAFQERAEPFPTAEQPPSELMNRWWSKMAPLMETESGNRPKHTPLSEVFAFETTSERAKCPD